MSTGHPSPDRRSELKAEDFDVNAVETALSAGDWQGWDEFLHWLRTDGPGLPGLSAGQQRGIRQDAERACARGVPFDRDPEQLYALLRQQHRARMLD
jgi:hypothetical protein